MNIEIITANSASNVIKGVKSVSLMLEDGKVLTLPLTPSLTLRAQENKKTVEHAVNSLFATWRSYYELADLVDLVATTLQRHGLDDVTDILKDAIRQSPKSGGVRSLPVGNGLYLVCLWYQMPSGKYELTAYLS